MQVGVGVGHKRSHAHTHTHTRTHTHTHLPKNHLGPPLLSSSLLQQHASSDGEEEWSGSGSE